MKKLSDLLSTEYGEKIEFEENCFCIPSKVKLPTMERVRVNLLALGDVGGTLLMGLRLLGGGIVEEIGIYDLDEKVLRRYEREINQITYPDGRNLPKVKILDEEELFHCDIFLFCASKGVPSLTAVGDVRMAQLEANRQLVGAFARKALGRNFQGLFAVISDPVDPLCKAVVDEGLEPTQVQGYGLGVMNGRARYFAEAEEKFGAYLGEGRAFGPHGEDLVIANSLGNYDNELSLELTELAVKSNMVTREDGFKPYIAPAMSSGALSILETIRGGWNYSSNFFGQAFLGSRNKREGDFIKVENLPLNEELFNRIEKAYVNLVELK